jgi:hypothetical protein
MANKYISSATDALMRNQSPLIADDLDIDPYLGAFRPQFSISDAILIDRSTFH